MLAEAIAAEPRMVAARVLDLCTGSGVLAVSAARAGAAEVTAVDRSRRAVVAARVNARLNGVRVRGLRGDLFAAVAGERFDVIVSNPPYIPSADDELPERGARRAWDAGSDGRLVLDRMIDGARGHLRPGGALMLVHSSLCGIEPTLERLACAGMQAGVVARRRGPIGPIVRERAELLESRGILAPGERDEEVVIVRAEVPELRPVRAAPAVSAAPGPASR